MASGIYLAKPRNHTHSARGVISLGATVVRGGTHFRVWAPQRRHVEVVLENGSNYPLKNEGNGYFSGTVSQARESTLYRYRLDGGEVFPDPCSRYQPKGPHGPSLVVDPASFRWKDTDWKGSTIKGQVLYELHVGTFTRAGTFDAAAKELDELKRLGITLIELMPVAEFPGRFNWGYDGVDLYAPSHLYGDPESLKRFVDAAHARRLGVILDVVYNHLGPDGNYLKMFSKDYFTDRHHTDWGEAINYDGPNAAQVREFFIGNACYWIKEFHMDGLRLDATQNIYDDGPVHVLSELSHRAREAASPRKIILIGENESQDVRCLAPVEKGGFGFDAMWADDFHHTARVAVTGLREAYLIDYLGGAQEFVSSVKQGFLFQGQHYFWQKKRRGTPVTEQPASAFVFYTQNHDQISNHAAAERLQRIAHDGIGRALTALLLLSPETPLLFMGQEFHSSNPFFFFADHNAQLAPLVFRGRKKFLAQFPSYAKPAVQAMVPDPSSERTFERCKLNFAERRKHGSTYRMHKMLLCLRREDPVLSQQDRRAIEAAVLSKDAFVLRLRGRKGDDRLLAVNLGEKFACHPAPEPLLAPPAMRSWDLVFSTDDKRFGGPGITNPDQDGKWTFPRYSANFFATAHRGKR